jgi:putative ABC transport system substrate-binding protein
MANRRHFLQASTLFAMAPAFALAQARPLRIGLLASRPYRDSNYIPSILRRLAELGYREGPGMVLEPRSADGVAERFPKLALELIERKCDLIFAVGPEQAVRALRDARSAIPVVFLAVDFDPVEKGIVSSFVRPDGNMTGVYVPQNALVAKRVEIMREVVPKARRFLIFVDPFSKDQMGAVQKAAQTARVELTVIEFIKPPYDLPAGLEAGRKAKVEGLVLLGSPSFGGSRSPLSDLLKEHRLPGIGPSAAYAASGMLLSLGADVGKTTQRVAEIAVRILKGAKPADIPVEQSDEYELVVNLKTAKALGVKIPYSVMARATKLIE